MKRIQFAAAATLLTLSLTNTALAQYVWIDDKGVKQYSDMPPPPSVPSGRILRQPPGGASSYTPPSTPTATAETAAPGRTEMTTEEKNAEFRKRRAEQAEKEKKAAEEARFKADKAKHCARAREYQRALESGTRISRTDKNGERAFMSDEQRAQETRDTKRALEDCK